MKNDPKLTICIPTYNRANRLSECIKQVLKCKSANIEILVSDNGSEDHTIDVLRAVDDRRFKYIRNANNVGFALNLINVVKEASALYVCLLSDEDFIDTGYIDSLLENEFNSEVKHSLIYGSIINDSKLSYLKKRKDRLFQGNAVFKHFTFAHPYLSGMIICKKGIDFEKMFHYAKTEKHLLYPHEIMAFMALKYSDIAITKSSICCIQGKPLKSQILEELTYNNPKYRLEVFDQFIRIAENLEFKKIPRNMIYREIKKRISNNFVSPANKKLYNQEFTKRDYLKASKSITHTSYLDLFSYIIWSKAFFLKKRLF